jgi:hypothetical protein
MHALVKATHDLCRAVDGVDWSAAGVRDANERLASAGDVTPRSSPKRAPPSSSV